MAAAAGLDGGIMGSFASGDASAGAATCATTGTPAPVACVCCGRRGGALCRQEKSSRGTMLTSTALNVFFSA